MASFVYSKYVWYPAADQIWWTDILNWKPLLCHPSLKEADHLADHRGLIINHPLTIGSLLGKAGLDEGDDFKSGLECHASCNGDTSELHLQYRPLWNRIGEDSETGSVGSTVCDVSPFYHVRCHWIGWIESWRSIWNWLKRVTILAENWTGLIWSTICQFLSVANLDQDSSKLTFNEILSAVPQQVCIWQTDSINLWAISAISALGGWTGINHTALQLIFSWLTSGPRYNAALVREAIF